jgi:hypothetical protein
MNGLQITHDDDAVATYATVDGAERAVAHLVSLGYDERDVGIAPRDFEVVDPRGGTRSLGDWTRMGLIAGAASMALIAVSRQITTEALFDSVLPLIALGVVVGAALGFVLGIASWRSRRRSDFLPAPDELAPTRFEVVVDRERDRARHGLARWWDPAAPPAEWQQPA